MAQQSIKPTQQMASHFVAAIVSFLRSVFGEEEYNALRIGDLTKKIAADYCSVQFVSLANKDITSLWNFFQKTGTSFEFDVTNITPGGSNDKVTIFKVSLDLSKKFLLEYGNDNVKDFCKESISEDDDQNQAGGSVEEPNQQDKQQGSEGNTQIPPNLSEESPEIEEEEISDSDDDDNIIKTVQELIETVSVLDSEQKVTTVSKFFIWYLDQNGINKTDLKVLPRTAYKYQGNKPEFVVRVLVIDYISKVFDLFQSQGCDVDLVGGNKDGVRVKSLSVSSTQPEKTKDQKSIKPHPKKAAKGSKKSKKKIVKKSTPKTNTKSYAKPKIATKIPKEIKKTALKAKPRQTTSVVIEPEFNFFRERFLTEFTEVVEAFLSKPERTTEKDVDIFQEMIDLKKQELEVLGKLEKDFDELKKVRESFEKKYSS